LYLDSEEMMEDEDEFVDNNFCQNEFNKKILEDPDEFADI